MKAQGLSMSILVVAAIAVMVLLLLGVFFTGGFKTIGTNMMNFIGGTTGGGEKAAEHASCSDWCTKNSSWTYPGEYPGRPPGCDFC